MASLNAYFAHRELQIPGGKAIKNLQDTANIQWHRYIKKSNNICYSLKSDTEKYKRDAQRSPFGQCVLFISDLCRFSPDFVSTLLYVLICSRNMVNPT